MHLTQAGFIRTGVRVKRVDWGESPIKIETARSDGLHLIQHHARQPVSASLACLFAIRLPPNKRTAIENTGFGALDNIFLACMEVRDGMTDEQAGGRVLEG